MSMLFSDFRTFGHARPGLFRRRAATRVAPADRTLAAKPVRTCRGREVPPRVSSSRHALGTWTAFAQPRRRAAPDLARVPQDCCASRGNALARRSCKPRADFRAEERRIPLETCGNRNVGARECVEFLQLVGTILTWRGVPSGPLVSITRLLAAVGFGAGAAAGCDERRSGLSPVFPGGR